MLQRVWPPKPQWWIFLQFFRVRYSWFNNWIDIVSLTRTFSLSLSFLHTLSLQHTHSDKHKHTHSLSFTLSPPSLSLSLSFLSCQTVLFQEMKIKKTLFPFRDRTIKNSHSDFKLSSLQLRLTKRGMMKEMEELYFLSQIRLALSHFTLGQGCTTQFSWWANWFVFCAIKGWFYQTDKMNA